MNASSQMGVGTSGWHYDHWKGPFYPEDLPAENFLSCYAERLGAAETALRPAFVNGAAPGVPLALRGVSSGLSL